MVSKTLSIPKTSCTSRLVLYDASRVLARISSAKDESFIPESGKGFTFNLCICRQFTPNLVAALKDLYNARGVLSMSRKFSKSIP